MTDIRLLFEKLSPVSRKAMEAAAVACVKAQHFEVDVEHFLLALLEPGSQFHQAFSYFELDIDQAKAQLRAELDTRRGGSSRTPALSHELVELVESAWQCGSLRLGAAQITSGAVLLAALDGDVARRMRARFPELGKIPGARLVEALPELARLSAEATVLAAPAASAPPAPAVATDPPKVFLSYRRSDTEKMAQTLYYCLRGEVQGIEIFRDGNSLQPGEVFADVIQQSIARCDALIMLIGKKWLNAKDKDGRLRLSDTADWVRLEAAEALRQGKKVFPCLIDGARMPASDDLPPEIRGLTERHATPIATASFQRDIEPLVKALQRCKA